MLFLTYYCGMWLFPPTHPPTTTSPHVKYHHIGCAEKVRTTTKFISISCMNCTRSCNDIYHVVLVISLCKLTAPTHLPHPHPRMSNITIIISICLSLYAPPQNASVYCILIVDEVVVMFWSLKNEADHGKWPLYPIKTIERPSHEKLKICTILSQFSWQMNVVLYLQIIKFKT